MESVIQLSETLFIWIVIFSLLLSLDLLVSINPLLKSDVMLISHYILPHPR